MEPTGTSKEIAPVKRNGYWRRTKEDILKIRNFISFFRAGGADHQMIIECLAREGYILPRTTYFNHYRVICKEIYEAYQEDQKILIAEILLKQEQLFLDAKHASMASGGVRALAVANRILDSQINFLQSMGLLPDQKEKDTANLNKPELNPLNEIMKEAIEHVIAQRKDPRFPDSP